MNKDGKIYTDGEYGVSVIDVFNVLGENTLDVGSLCSSSKINPWSKCKPVKLANCVEVARIAKGSGWYKGDDGFCGFNLSNNMIEATETNINNIDQLYNEKWTYNPPTGGMSAPYRLSDFENYNHNAKFPLDSIQISATETQSVNGVVSDSYDLNIHFNSTIVDGSLDLTDITPSIYTGTASGNMPEPVSLSRWYLGAVIEYQKKSSSSTTKIIKSTTYSLGDTVIESQKYDIKFKLENAVEGQTIKVYPVIIQPYDNICPGTANSGTYNTGYTGISAAANLKMLPIPNFGMQQYVLPRIVICKIDSIVGTYSVDANVIKYNFTVNYTWGNSSATRYTVPLYFQIRDNQLSVRPPVFETEYNVIEPLSVTFEKDKTSLTFNYSNNGKLCTSLNNFDKDSKNILSNSNISLDVLIQFVGRGEGNQIYHNYYQNHTLTKV